MKRADRRAAAEGRIFEARNAFDNAAGYCRAVLAEAEAAQLTGDLCTLARETLAAFDRAAEELRAAERALAALESKD